MQKELSVFATKLPRIYSQTSRQNHQDPFASGKRSFLGASVADCSSASAVIGLTKGYAEYLAPFQVTANCVEAGLIRGCEPSIEGKTLAEVQEFLPTKWQSTQNPSL